MGSVAVAVGGGVASGPAGLVMRDEDTTVGSDTGASLRRLRRRLLWGTAALVAVLFVLWWRWQVDLWLLLEMVGFSVAFVIIAALAGLCGGGLLMLIRRSWRGSTKLGSRIGSGPGRQRKGLT